MNESFFYVLEKIKLFWKNLKEILRLRLDQKLGLASRLLQLFAWSIILCLTTLPITNVCLFLADLAGKGTLLEAFWSIIGMCAVTGGILGALFLLISIPTFLIWSILRKIKLDLKSKTN